MRTEKIDLIKNNTILAPVHISKETAYVIENYPYGSMRTKMYVWIESNKKKGDRVVRQTINPKNGLLNKPKMSTYSAIFLLYINKSTGHLESLGLWEHDTTELVKCMREAGKQIDLNLLNPIQIDNLKNMVYSLFVYGLKLDTIKYKKENIPNYVNWVIATAKHWNDEAPADMFTFPEAPVQDEPEKNPYVMTINGVAV